MKYKLTPEELALLLQIQAEMEAQRAGAIRAICAIRQLKGLVKGFDLSTGEMTLVVEGGA